MEFIVTRTSDKRADPQCGAVAKIVTHIDELDFVPPKNYSWWDTGTNHRVENERATKIMTETIYVVRFSGLPALVAFVRKYDKCIVDWEPTYNLPTIEIYDDYRE